MADDGAPVRLIAGPTASGKSAVALELARRIGGVVVNADALQLYADLRILTARPSAEEEAQAPHRLYGVADAADGWSVGRWLEAAQAVLAEAGADGRPAVVVGGTGLYFRALTQGLADVPAIPAAAREEAEARFAREGEAAFRAALAERDPAAAERIFPGDRQRLVRAFEVALATGKPLSAWQAETAPTLAAEDWSAVVLEPPRETLYARCDRRLEAMLDEGALAEVEALMARGLDPALPAMKATGLRELAGFLRGEWSREEAIEAAQRETRRYAKRQLTWLRNQTPTWPRLSST
ncbi:MAG: tRNA (adenosine(37)-N6)-dimethylallyltransferase MiaA [Proteobacteria bacterium]|nr:tRNA (adenosine(37)-N6)-dimethylallyltransferase MiaA [Pseudomonadota bacterium]